MDITVKFVPKDKIYPAFGYLHYSPLSFGFPALMEVRDDLNRFEVSFLLVHEFGHMDDMKNKEGFIHKELESNFMGLFYPIIGAVLIAVKSLSPDRLKWYWKRWKEGK
jgi:hypothetical protein